jgi:hypothetical protein
MTAAEWLFRNLFSPRGLAAAERTLATAPPFDPRTVAMSQHAKWVALGSWVGHGVSILSPQSAEHVAQVSAGLQASSVHE